MKTESATLRVGDRAPGFTLPTQKGQSWTLAEVLSHEPVLLAFHRGTW